MMVHLFHNKAIFTDPQCLFWLRSGHIMKSGKQTPDCCWNTECAPAARGAPKGRDGEHCQLTHWGQVMHISISKLTIVGSDNGLLPDRRQAIIRTNARILLIGPLGTNFSEILIEIQTCSFKKMHLNMSSGKWRPFCLNLNVLITLSVTLHRVCESMFTYMFKRCYHS